MAKRMKLWVAGGLLLAVGGTVLASNMGFKFVPNLNQASKTFTISLPLNNNYTDGASVFNDINASGCSAGKVERINPSTGGTSRTTWAGDGTDNFPIAKGEGYIVEVGSSCTSWVVVGSHDPAYVYNFPLASKTYLTTIPYHTTATLGSQLYTSIPNCSKIERINPSTGGTSRTTWAGDGTDDFPVQVGQAYIVEVSANSSWTPSHY